MLNRQQSAGGSHGARIGVPQRPIRSWQRQLGSQTAEPFVVIPSDLHGSGRNRNGRTLPAFCALTRSLSRHWEIIRPTNLVVINKNQ